MEHGEELFFVDDGDAEFAGFFEFSRSHVIAGEHIGCGSRDATHIFSAVLLNHSFVFFSRMAGKHTAYHNFFTLEEVGAIGEFFLAQAELHTGFAQALYDGHVVGISEEIHDRIGDFGSYFRNGREFECRHLHQSVDGMHIAGEHFGCSFAHEGNADGKEHAFKGHFERFANAIENAACGFC